MIDRVKLDSSEHLYKDRKPAR